MGLPGERMKSRYLCGADSAGGGSAFGSPHALSPSQRSCLAPKSIRSWRTPPLPRGERGRRA